MTQKEYRRWEWESLGLESYVTCRYCMARATDAAHVVEASKRNIEKYGFRAVYHRDNLIPTCRKHNDTAMNETRGQAAEELHMALIQKKLDKEGIE